MRTNVLVAIICHCGLAATVIAQPIPPSVEARLVLDNDPILASMGINYGSLSLLPGPSATAVAITIVARATTLPGQPNYGVQGTTNFLGNRTPGNPNGALSVISHNDLVSNQTRSNWTSPALAFQRGYSFITSDATPATNNYGLMRYPDSDGNQISFRGGIGIANTPSSNRSSSLPIPTSPVTYQSNGWIGVPPQGSVAPSIAGSGVILGMAASRASIPDPDEVLTNPFTNYAGSNGLLDQDPNTPFIQSPWYALYRFVFVPRTGDDLRRDVTVTWSSSILTVGSVAFYAAGAWFLGFGDLVPGTRLGIEIPNPTITFTVPTPSALGLLSLGALISTRRRR